MRLGETSTGVQKRTENIRMGMEAVSYKKTDKTREVVLRLKQHSDTSMIF